MTLAEPVTAAVTVTAAGTQWKWQLRDKNGRWIQMGSEVSFSINGKTITGIIVGSPGPGKAIVKLPNGSTVTVATAGVTSTGRGAAPSAGGVAQQAGQQAAQSGARGAAGAADKPIKAVAPALKDQPKQERRDREHAARRRRVDGINAVDRTARSIEDLIRARAGRKDPFGENKKSGSKSKGSRSKDGKDAKGSAGHSDQAGSTKPRKDTRKKLTQSQIDAVGDIMKGVLADVRRGSYSAALAKLDKAEKLLENTSAPWFNKKINFLQKGLKGLQSLTASGVRHVRTPGGVRHYGQPIGAVIVADPVSRAIKAALRPGRDGWTKVEKYGLDYDPQYATNPAVVGARAVPESVWDAVPVQDWKLPLTGGTPLHANEPDLKNKTLAKVHEPGFEFRSGYFNLIVIDTEGRAHIVDGHHRVGLHAEAGHDSLPAKVIDVREDTPAAAAVRKAAKIPRALTSAGQSWRWQLRDSQGRWIEMGSKVKWMASGKVYLGKVVDSPAEGQATVEDDQGRRVQIAANRLSLTEAPAASGPAMVSRRERRQLGRQERKAQKAQKAVIKQQTPAMAQAMSEMADNIRTDVDPENWAAAAEATGEVIVGEIAGHLPKRLQLLERVKAIRERGVDAQRRLAVFFHTHSVLEKHLNGAKFWAGEFLGDQSGTDNPTPSWSAIPTMLGLPNPASHPVEFLAESGKMITQLLKAASALVSSAVTAAGSDSWRWQLRDKDGQWIDMGSRVSWFARGLMRTGILIGSPKEGTARVREDKTGAEFNMPSATRLTALPEVGNKVRYTTGGKNPKAVLAEVIGLPKAGRVTVRDLRTGKEKVIAEKTVKVLPLDRLRENVREFGGLSTKIEGTEPKRGYMAAQLKGSVQMTPEEFFGAAGEDALFDFMRANQAQFDSDPNVYLGLWYDEKDNKVVIDVSHNIADRDTAVLAGRYQDQKSVWDVVNMEEIDTGGTGGYGQARDEVRPTAEEGVGDDRPGVAHLGQAADLRAQEAVDDRRWIRRPPPVGGLRVVDARSSMAAFGPQEWAFINNDGGTLADPRHITHGVGNMSASMSDVTDHYDEVIRAALAGIPENAKVDPAELASAKDWYQQANEVCQDLLAKYQDQIPGLTLTKVTGVMAAMSPRMGWKMNIAAAEKILKKQADPEFRALPTVQAKELTRAGMHGFVEDSLRILRGEGDPNEIMSGLKRKSFWNCMLDPSNTWDVCMDGWMASATRRAGLKNLDGGDLDEKALDWLDHSMDTKQTETVDGAGYIVLADALRIAAARNHLTPMQAQAVYWIAVGGGTEGAVMWTDERRAKGTSPLARLKARQREERLRKALLPIEVPA